MTRPERVKKITKDGRILLSRRHWWQPRRRGLLCCYGECRLYGISFNYIDGEIGRYTFCSGYHREKFREEMRSDVVPGV